MNTNAVLHICPIHHFHILQRGAIPREGQRMWVSLQISPFERCSQKKTVLTQVKIFQWQMASDFGSLLISSVSLLRSFLWLRMFSYWSLWSTQAWRIVIWKLYSWKSGFIKSNVDFKRYQNYVFSKKYPPIQQPPSPQSSSLLPFSLTIFTSSIFEKLRTKMFTLTVVGSSENNWFKEMDYR